MDSYTDDTSRRQAAWSRYWATGALHSCCGSYDGNYDGAIGQVWQQTFAALRPDARVLDIATGNGPIPRLFLEHAAAAGASQCDAIDLADIAPPWLDELPEHLRSRLRFHARTSAEQLPFADGSFDLVASQFGIEYGDPSRTIAQAARVMRPGAGLAFVMHHRDSITVRLALEETTYLEWLLGSGGLLDAAAAMLEPLSRAVTAQGRAALARDSAAERIRLAFNERQDQVAERIARAECPDVLHEVRVAIAQTLALSGQEPLPALLQRHQALRRYLLDSQLRLREVTASALDTDAMARWVAGFAEQSVECRCEPLVDRNEVVGWLLRGTRVRS